MAGIPEDGLKRAYHTPTVQEFGSVSQNTQTYGDFYIPPWLDYPHDTPGGDGGGDGGLS